MSGNVLARLPQTPEPATASEDRLNDIANAERLVEQHGGKLRYLPVRKSWLVWDGQRWAIDEMGQAVELAKATARSIYVEAAECKNMDLAKKLSKHASKTATAPRIAAMLQLARSSPGIPVASDELDSDPMLLNVENGTVDLRTGKVRTHVRGDLITKLCPVKFTRDECCPRWLQFLTEIMGGNDDLIAFLQRAIGYSLTGDTSERCLFICHGSGANGKTTLLETIRELLGDYSASVQAASLMIKRDDGGPRNDLAALRGARFVVAAEGNEGRRLDEALVKQVAGGDQISARFLHNEWFSYTPTFKLWLGTNHRPTIGGTDNAIWDRLRLIPFEVTIPEEGRDHQLRDKLRAELPGILQWAVEGCLDWGRGGLGVPAEVRQATAEYRTDSDVVAAFINDRCEIDPGGRAFAGELYRAFKDWSKDNGEHPMTKAMFGRRLGSAGFKTGKVDRKHVRRGLRLASAPS